MMVENPFQFNRADPMGPTYAFMFYSLFFVTCVLAWLSQPTSARAISAEGRRVKWHYLSVWYVCVAGDWLQGPYVYALYAAYGFSRAEISQLFVAGFGASMLFGTVVGSLGDKIGRKRTCQLYCILYILSCMTKHCGDYWVLMLGRLTGGIATSLLFSGFESWLVAEATAVRHLDRDTLGHIFALMWFGSSLVAILAGVMGDIVVGLQGMEKSGQGMWHYGGFISPFDLAIALLTLGLWLISSLWEENYGSATASPQVGGQSRGAIEDLREQIRNGVSSIAHSHQLFILMVMVACFEGSMYTFVFNWTPALESKFSTPAFGMVFATFMMAYMCGSSTFDLLRGKGVGVMALAQAAMFLGAASFLVAGIANRLEVTTGHLTFVLIGFICFEFCCGLYFPAISSLKGQCVPEVVRSTIYNIYRLPMNAIVLVVLLTNITIYMVFIICFALLVIAGLATLGFGKAAPAPKKEEDVCNLESGEASSLISRRPGKALDAC
jgi:MFS family permease